MSAVVAGTRERLLRSAQELVEEGGYGAASVPAVAERAGVAAGTLYRYWPSKGDLFAELFRVVCDREVAAMAGAARVARESQVASVEAVLVTFAERALRNAPPREEIIDALRAFVAPAVGARWR